MGGWSIRVAQNAPNMKNLPGHQSYLCFLPSWWEKCIETSKKLIARVGTQHLLLGLHLPYGYQGKNAIFWLVSFLTPLIAWKTQTNIGKQLCISQCPTRGPKSTKIQLMDQILALRSDLESLKCSLKNHFFDFFLCGPKCTKCQKPSGTPVLLAFFAKLVRKMHWKLQKVDA